MQEVIGSTPIYSTAREGRNDGPFLVSRGVVAHLVEHLVRNQKVVGSSPIYSTKKRERLGALFFYVADGPEWVVGCQQMPTVRHEREGATVPCRLMPLHTLTH